MRDKARLSRMAGMNRPESGIGVGVRVPGGFRRVRSPRGADAPAGRAAGRLAQQSDRTVAATRWESVE